MNYANCETNTATAIRPRVDISEIQNGVRLEGELPGVSKDDTKVEIREGQLIIEGSRKRDETKSSWHLRERPDADFYRAFEIGDTLDTDAVNATMVDGVLTVELSKKAEHAPRTVAIN